MKTILILLLIFMNIMSTYADDLMSTSLEDLLNISLNTSSYKETPIREQPGIITYITREQIKNSGASDLIDVLNLVPGFGFDGECCEVVGISMRGIWANEGKVLITIDGTELNETLYGTLQFNNHISADLIEMIEIIRGPGSSMYGGTAEMGVIKITTRGGTKEETWVQGAGSLNKGKINGKFDAVISREFEDWKYSVSVSTKKANRSNETLHDDYGQSYDLTDKSDFSNLPLFVNINYQYKDIDLRVIRDNYSYKFQDYYGIQSNGREEIFNSTLIDLKYKWKISDKLTLIPKYTHKEHDTWNHKIDGVYRWNIKGTRNLLNITSNYNLRDDILLAAGLEYFEDRGSVDNQTGVDPQIHYAGMGSGNKAKFDNKSIFSQAEYTTTYGNFTFGGRYEDNERSGDKLVKRGAYTKVWTDWHLKVLYGEAFRTPHIEILNYNLGNSTKKMTMEETTAHEIEVGKKISQNNFVKLNLYNVEIEKPILYLASGAYENGDTISSHGLELEYTHIPDWGRIQISYSIYKADKQGTATWASDISNENAAMPPEKLSYTITYKFSDRLKFNSNGYFTSAVRSFDDLDVDYTGNTKIFQSTEIINIFLSYQFNKWDMGIGISDLLNDKELFAPAYDNYSGAIPAMSRTLFTKASYDF